MSYKIDLASWLLSEGKEDPPTKEDSETFALTAVCPETGKKLFYIKNDWKFRSDLKDGKADKFDEESAKKEVEKLKSGKKDLPPNIGIQKYSKALFENANLVLVMDESDDSDKPSMNVIMDDLEDSIRDKFTEQNIGRETWSFSFSFDNNRNEIFLTVSCDSKKGSPSQLMRSESERFRTKMASLISYTKEQLTKNDIKFTIPELNLKKYIQDKIDNDDDGYFTEYQSAEFSAYYSISIPVSK